MKNVLFFLALGLCGCHHQELNAASLPAPASRIELSVTADGFVPARHRVKAGESVTLVITRKVERTCAKEIVIKEYDVNTPLPIDKPVEVKKGDRLVQGLFLHLERVEWEEVAALAPKSRGGFGSTG